MADQRRKDFEEELVESGIQLEYEDIEVTTASAVVVVVVVVVAAVVVVAVDWGGSVGGQWGVRWVAKGPVTGNKFLVMCSNMQFLT